MNKKVLINMFLGTLHERLTFGKGNARFIEPSDGFEACIVMALIG